MIACIRCAKVPKFSFNGQGAPIINGGTLRSSKVPRSRGATPKVETSAPLLFQYGHPLGDDQSFMISMPLAKYVEAK